jgi:hypothetical protein
MIREIVVTRYNEDLSWLTHDVFSDIRLHVYDHSDRDSNYLALSIARLIKCPNRGMNLSSMWDHLLTQREQLADMTYFVQGYPFDHCANIIDRIAAANSNYDDLSDKLLVSNGDGSPDHLGLAVQEAFEWMFKKPWPGTITFNPATMFAIPRNVARRHSAKEYEHMLAISDGWPLGPYVSERLARYFFVET